MEKAEVNGDGGACQNGKKSRRIDERKGGDGCDGHASGGGKRQAQDACHDECCGNASGQSSSFAFRRVVLLSSACRLAPLAWETTVATTFSNVAPGTCS